MGMEKSEALTFIRMVIVLAAGVMLGVFLLCLAFMLPDGPIQSNIRDSVYVFETEELYPAMDSSPAKVMDNWTDSLMLLDASFKKENAGILERAMGIYGPRYLDSLPIIPLIRYCRGEEGFNIVSNAGYWYGYLVFLRPFLCLMDYGEFRVINSVMVYVVLILIIWIMVRRKYLFLVPAYILSMLFLRPDVMGRSLRYSLVYYVINAAVLVGITLESWMRERQLVPFYFLIIGMVTSYMDLLSYPLVTLGIPLALWMALSNGSWEERAEEVVSHSLEWLSGYIGMWMGKWCLASFVLDRDVFSDVFRAAYNWSLRDYAGKESSCFAVILRNVEFGASGIWLLIGTVSLALIGWLLSRIYRGRRRMVEYILPFFAIFIMPFIWYAIWRDHSAVYSWLTYRNLAVTICAAVCMGTGRNNYE